MGKDILVSWLQSAIAMEKTTEEMLEGHAREAEQDTDFQDKIKEGILRSKEHQEKLKSAIELSGGRYPKSDSRIGQGFRISGVQGHSNEEKLLKNAQVGYAIGYFEIAVYSTLIRLADKLGQQEVVGICKDIQLDHIDKVQWLQNIMPFFLDHYFISQNLPSGEGQGDEVAA